MRSAPLLPLPLHAPRMLAFSTVLPSYAPQACCVRMQMCPSCFLVCNASASSRVPGFLYSDTNRQDSALGGGDAPGGSIEAGRDATAACRRLAALGSRPRAAGTFKACCQLETLRAVFASATGFLSHSYEPSKLGFALSFSTTHAECESHGREPLMKFVLSLLKDHQTFGFISNGQWIHLASSVLVEAVPAASFHARL